MAVIFIPSSQFLIFHATFAMLDRRHTFAFVDKILAFVAKSKYDKVMITTFIKNDLAARLKSGGELPAQLTIDALASYYKVSFTPVRTAVQELIGEGLLKKGPNRRLVARGPAKGSLRIKPTALPAATGTPALPGIAAVTLPPDPFDRVASDLVKLSLNGESIYLREETTAAKYDISRSVMRSILHRLSGEGVVDHIPRRGWRLRPFLQRDLQAFIEVREVLELKALELAQSKLVPRELKQMLESNQLPESRDAMPQIDESLHQYLIEKAGNTYIRDFFERQGRYYRLLFEWEDRSPNVAMETVRQHREILLALLNRNWSAARKALSHHIRDNHPILNQVKT